MTSSSHRHRSRSRWGDPGRSEQRLTPSGSGSEPILVVDGVSKAYRSDGLVQPVLSDVTFTVAPGEFVAVLGPSGSGKTSLLNLIGGLDTADSGRLWACGTDLTNATPTELVEYRARNVGFVFQFYNLLPTLTALENVVAGMTVAGIGRTEATARAASVLEQLGLADVASKFPSQLSGGEQQRAAIARALAKRPQLVLADEPTGNLDGEAGEDVLALMRRLNADTGATFVLVTHDTDLAANVSRTIRLADGRLVDEGSVL